MEDTIVPSLSLRDLVVILFRHLRAVIAILLLTLLGTAIDLYGMHTTLYDVTAKVLIRPGQAQAPPASVSESTNSDMNYHFDAITPELALFQSHEVVGAVVDHYHMTEDTLAPPGPGAGARLVYRIKLARRKLTAGVDGMLRSLGLREPLSRREVAIEQLQNSFVTTPTKDTNIVDLHLLLPTRKGSGDLLNTWIDEYQKFRLGFYKGSSGIDFFEQQTGAAKQRLTSAEDALRQFDDTYRLSDPGKQELTLLDEKARAEQELVDVQIAERQLQQRVDLYTNEQRHHNAEFLVMASPERDSLLSSLLLQLQDLERDRQKLSMTDLDTSERMVNNKEQFETLRAAVVAHLNSLLVQRRDEAAARKQVLSDLNARLALVHDKETDETRLKRSVTVGEAEYMTLEKRYQDAFADARLRAANTGDVIVVSSAVDPLSATGTRKAVVFAIAFMAGIMVSLAWITIAEFFDDRIHTGSTVERLLGGPVVTIAEANG